MARLCALIALVMVVAGCGVAATGTATATGAASEAQQAAQARQTEERVRQQIDAAYSQDAERRRAAETDGQ